MNRPSIILWSLGNEVYDLVEPPNSGDTRELRAFLGELKAIVRETDATRPTSDRVREALFSILGSRIVVHEILIAVFITLTMPATLMLLGRAALHRDRDGCGSSSRVTRRSCDLGAHLVTAGGRYAALVTRDADENYDDPSWSPDSSSIAMSASWSVWSTSVR